MTTTSDESKPKKIFGKSFLLFMVGSIASIYILQFLLDTIFRLAGPDDDMTAALYPFQNHYLSFSPYFVTTEGMSGEFTNDVTGAGRFFGGIIVPFVALLVASIVLYFIKPIRKYFDKIWMLSFIAILAIVFLNALFVPPKKTIFNPEIKEITFIKNASLISSVSTVLKFEEVKKIEFDFLKDYDGYALQTIVYCQLYAVVDEKRIVLGENEVDSFGGKENNWQPSEEQKATAQKGIRALNRLLNMSTNK